MAYGVAVDNAGNSYITGVFSGTATFGTHTLTSVGSGDGFVVKYDPNGNVLWARRFGGIDYDEGRGVAVNRVNGDVYVTGRFQGTSTWTSPASTVTLNASSITFDAFVAKYNTNGDVLWVTNFASYYYTGGYDVAVDNAGNVYATGYFQNQGQFNSAVGSGGPVLFAGNWDGRTNAYIAKLNTNGAMQWARNSTGSVYGAECGYGIAWPVRWSR